MSRAGRAVRRGFKMGAILASSALAVFVAWLLFVWPPPSWYRSHWPSETAFMRLRAGQYRAAGDTTPRHYRPVPLDSIDDWLERTVLVGEDDAFYQHHGIDYRQLREVLGYRYQAFDWRRGRDRAELWRVLSRAQDTDAMRGASTITQQLAKNLYLSPSRNPLRKIKEAVIAWRIEQALEKDRILELYLSVAELGENVWGAEAAARRYFGRGASRLSMDQAAMLAATLPHPRSSNPGYRPGRTRYRANLLMERLRGPASEERRAESEVPDTLPIDTIP